VILVNKIYIILHFVPLLALAARARERDCNVPKSEVKAKRHTSKSLTLTPSTGVRNRAPTPFAAQMVPMTFYAITLRLVRPCPTNAAVGSRLPLCIRWFTSICSPIASDSPLYSTNRINHGEVLLSLLGRWRIAYNHITITAEPQFSTLCRCSMPIRGNTIP
jgi:hypothetical protein